MSLFGKNVRTDIIILAVIAAIAGPVLALKLPLLLAILATAGTIGMVVFIANICITMPASLALIAVTAAMFSAVMRLTLLLVLAPTALLSLNGLLTVVVAGLWVWLALGAASRTTSWGDRTAIGGGGFGPRG